MRGNRQNQIQFTIPEPCNIPWDGMTPVDKDQRHCSSCDRVITDFSKMSDDELMLYFRHASGKMCGRFSKSQINRPFQLLPDKSSKAKWWRTFFLFPLLIFGKSGKAQTVDSVKMSTVDSVALSKNFKSDSAHKEVTAVKKKKRHRKKLVTIESKPVGMICVPGEIMGGIGPTNTPYIPAYELPFLPHYLFSWFLPQRKDTISEMNMHRDLANQKEESPKPQHPALPSSDPFAGVLPDEKKYPWQV